MDVIQALLNSSGFWNISVANVFMFVIAGVLIYLAIAKEYEPLLLIPIGFGAILANIPNADMGSYGQGLLSFIYNNGIKTEFLPPMILKFTTLPSI